MEPQNKDIQNQTNQQPVEQANTPEAIPEKSQLSLPGLLLAVICPPLGLIVSIIALYKIKKSNLKGGGIAILGIIWGAIFTLPFLFLLSIFIALGGFQTNEAQKSATPLIQQIKKSGGKKICDNGDDGHGIDNTTPWYQAYYHIPDAPGLTQNIKSIAAKQGYQLKTDTSLINTLKGDSYGQVQFNPKSDYLVGSSGNRSLSITINRQASVALYCGLEDYGKEQSTGDKAIVDLHLTFPDRNE